MSTNETTEYMNVPQQNQPNQNARRNSPQAKDENNWAKIAIGGATGILIGAGTLFAVNAVAANAHDTDAADDAAASGELKEAHIDDSMSFSDAFAAARAEVGPGGVFQWHGGIYGTYTADEWNAMSAEEKADFVHSAGASVPVSDINTSHISAATPDVQVEYVHVVNYEQQPGADPEQQQDIHGGQAQQQQVHQNVHETSYGSEFNSGDVRVVGSGEVEGHTAVAVDLDGNGEADVAIVDVNDNNQVDGQDVAIFRDGSWYTMDDIANAATQGGGGSSYTTQDEVQQQDDSGNNVQQSDDDLQMRQASFEENDPNLDPNMQQASYETTDDTADVQDYSGDDGSDFQTV